MEAVFQVVYLFLAGMARLTGLTYEEVNILAYYLVLPGLYLAMLDRIWKRHLLKSAFAVLWLVIFLAVDFRAFSDRLFDGSVGFLRSFGWIGWNYTVASVMICVVFPFVVFSVLLRYSFWPDLVAFLRPPKDAPPDEN